MTQTKAMDKASCTTQRSVSLHLEIVIVYRECFDIIKVHMKCFDVLPYVSFELLRYSFLTGPIVEVIEDEELGGDDDEEVVASTATSLLSEEEYQEFLAEGSHTDGGEGASSVAEVTADAAKADNTTEKKDKASKGEEKEKENELEEKKKEDSVSASEGVNEQEREVKGDGKEGVKDKEGENGQQTMASSKREEADKSGANPPTVKSALVRKLTSYGNSRAASVSLQRRLSGMSSTHRGGPSGPGHVWDHVMLNCPQFVQLVELFLGPDPQDTIVDTLSSFLRNNYTETAQVGNGSEH